MCHLVLLNVLLTVCAPDQFTPNEDERRGDRDSNELDLQFHGR